jgi:hypothetical protein
MARAAKTIPSMLNTLPFGRLTNGWFIPPPTIGDSKTNYGIRAVIARVGLPAPAGPFLLILGTYAPGEAVIDSLSNPNAYIPPPAVVVK